MSDETLRVLQRAAVEAEGYRRPEHKAFERALDRAGGLCGVCLGAPQTDGSGTYLWRGILVRTCAVCRDTLQARETALERERVEWVFGLTGGELNDSPWHEHAHWYDGVPDYLGQGDYPDLYASGVDYVTVVSDTTIESPPGWVVADDYTSSGEAECPCRHDDDMGNYPSADCALCEGGGYIYLGDGWRETVLVHRTQTCDHCDGDMHAIEGIWTHIDATDCDA